MMKYQDSASFVYSIAKRARKYFLGMTTATQDVEDFLKNEYGKAVLTNSSIQVLLNKELQKSTMITNTFYLSEGEKALLLSADVGEGLFFAGQNHVAMKVFAAPFEHELITSNPMELLKKQQEKERMEQADAATKGTQTAVPMATNPTPSYGTAQSPAPDATQETTPTTYQEPSTPVTTTPVPSPSTPTS
jgi:hypothetical protein